MRYLKRFNEELKPQTYKNAAAALNRLGHAKRAAEIGEWAEAAQQKEEERKRKALIDSCSKNGIFAIDIGRIKGGKFYIWLDFEENNSAENWDYWMREGRFEGYDLWMALSIVLVPADQETFEMALNNLDFYGMNYWASELQIKMSRAIDQDSHYGDGWELELNDKDKRVFYIEGNEYTIKFSGRADAMKFRKFVIDVFEGNTETGETPENPGGVKEKIIDFYCNKKGVSMEEFENIVDSTKKITVNSIYQD